MALTEKEKNLIQQVHASSSIAGRFIDLECINVDHSGEKKGCFSLIFKAFDIVEDNQVILKFLSPEKLEDTYRSDAFFREPEILQKLSSKNRCLELVYGPDMFKWQIDIAGQPATINLRYFVTEYLPEDVEPFFLEQNLHEAVIKLELFRNILLAVQAVHNHDIYHRDIKYDNFRGTAIDNDSSFVKIIDFGTAAHLESPLLAEENEYPKYSVGAIGFSAPEQLSGLNRCREIGKFTDTYALGTLLFQLFNLEHFCKSSMTKDFIDIVHFLHMKTSETKDVENKLKIWCAEVIAFKHVLIPPPLNSNGNTLPLSIAPLLVDVHRQMTMFDFRDRLTDLDYVLKRIDNSLRVLNNIKLDKRKIKQRQLKRENKFAKLRRQEERLASFLRERQKVTYNA